MLITVGPFTQFSPLSLQFQMNTTSLPLYAALLSDTSLRTKRKVIFPFQPHTHRQKGWDRMTLLHLNTHTPAVLMTNPDVASPLWALILNRRWCRAKWNQMVPNRRNCDRAASWQQHHPTSRLLRCLIREKNVLKQSYSSVLLLLVKWEHWWNILQLKAVFSQTHSNFIIIICCTMSH